jgi:uncharacterized protein YqeY
MDEMAAESNNEPLRSRLGRVLRVAMKARNATAIAVLRTALGAIDNAEAIDISQAPQGEGERSPGGVAGLWAAEAPRRNLSESDMASIVRAEIDERLEVAPDYERAGRYEAAARLHREAALPTAHVDNTNP